MDTELKPRERFLPSIPGYQHESVVAKALGVRVNTLRRWRILRTGPAWTDVAHQIFYSDDAIRTWLKSREVQPVRQSNRECVA